MATAQEKIARLIEVIESGKTLYVTTALRATKITPKTLKKWKAAGHDLFKAHNGSMYMARGSKFVCIDYCNFTISEEP